MGGLIAASALFVINMIFKRIMLKSKFVKMLVQDKPQILIHDGKIDFKRESIILSCMNCNDDAYRSSAVMNADDAIADGRRRL